MKVAIVTDYHNQTGIGSQNYNLYLGLKKLGVDVDIINLVSKQGFYSTPDYGHNIMALKGVNKYIAFVVGVLYTYKKELKAYLTKNKYDIVILGHQGMAYLSGMLTKNNQKYVLIIDDLFPLYEYAKRFTITIYNKLLLRGIYKVQNIVYISDFTKKDYEKHFPRKDTYNGQTIHIGVDRKPFIEPNDKQYIKDQLAITDDTKIILNVGSEDSRKNIQSFLEVAKSFNDNNKVRFVRVGRMSQESQDYIAEHNLTNISYVSRLSDGQIAALYDMSHIVFSPALLEGYGKQIFEGYLYDNYMVTSDVSDVSGIFKNDSHVVIVKDPYDVNTYKQAIEKFLALQKKDNTESIIQSIDSEAAEYKDFLKNI